jgi:hypothetical protein
MKKTAFLLLLFLSCSTWDTSLILLNNSNESVYYYYDVIDKQSESFSLEKCDKTKLSLINVGAKKILRSQDKWDYTLKDNPSKSLEVCIINKDTLAKYGVCKIFSDQNFIKLYHLSYNDLVKMNWKIVYK